MALEHDLASAFDDVFFAHGLWPGAGPWPARDEDGFWVRAIQYTDSADGAMVLVISPERHALEMLDRRQARVRRALWWSAAAEKEVCLCLARVTDLPSELVELIAAMTALHWRPQ